MGTRLQSNYAVDQAERTIAGWILTGRYREGDRLPGIEELREELGVSYGTLSSAVGRLRTRRLLRFEPGEGMIVQSLNEFVGLDMFCSIITHCDEPWRRWVMLCQFYDFIRPLLVDWVERAASRYTAQQLEWLGQYTLLLEDRIRLKSSRADIGHAEYEFARVLAAGAENVCFTMVLNPLFDLYVSDVLVTETDTIVPPETYRSVLNALSEHDGKKAGGLLEAALWKRESVCIAELRKLGWTATGDPIDAQETADGCDAA
jgi:DNA-binding FadR family transcriptional regulator